MTKKHSSNSTSSCVSTSLAVVPGEARQTKSCEQILVNGQSSAEEGTQPSGLSDRN
ncbi:MAG TPA: hypothetical protein VK718_06700 [Ferruginibacter sp.]|nr:hypothetical protein [Ferruginibacter sp.]